MANLIIKASSGNSLVVQGADDSPAITVATDGATTFAEQVTVPNITTTGTATGFSSAALGTVTSGDISNSAIVFPAGHVLNVAFHRTTTSPAAHTGDDWSSTIFSTTYTFKHVNSSLVIQGQISWARPTGAIYWGYVKAERGGVSKMEIGQYEDTDTYFQSPFNFVDSGTHAVDDVWTYDIVLKSGVDGNAVQINQSPNTGFRSSFTYFEIAT